MMVLSLIYLVTFLLVFTSCRGGCTLYSGPCRILILAFAVRVRVVGSSMILVVSSSPAFVIC